ncbi:hypothetical protein [Psychromonas arctica]|uniref:hypothetical protein n=1 Tax=Psychromonas arctica TaxID=168275 RepID=UPI0003FD7292|nr:hypothetical protein [Psychromonas arctica]
MNTKQEKKAFNHEGTKGEEGKPKAITLLFKFFSFRLCSLMHLGVYLQRISP